MKIPVEDLSQLIQSRRTVFTEFYSGEELSEETLTAILETARWAPTHKRTEPWRYIVYHSKEARQSVTDMLRRNYLDETPESERNEVKEKKVSQRPLQAPVVIALILCRNEVAGLPEWEEVAALAAGVQNMSLASAALGLGSFWSTPGLATAERDFFELAPNERCLGLFYIGKMKEGIPEFGSSRKSLKEITKWL